MKDFALKAIGLAFRSKQTELYNKHNKLEGKLKEINQEIQNVVEEKLNNYYKIEETLKQEGLRPKVFHGDLVYILSQEGEELYNELEQGNDNVAFLEQLLATPEMFIVVELSTEYIDYCKKQEFNHDS